MEELRIHELCRYGIVRSAGSQILSCRCTFAVGVAALDHEILYHSMKQSSVEISFLGELYEVVVKDISSAFAVAPGMERLA